MQWKKVGGFDQHEVIDLTREGEGTETVGKLVDMREFPSQYGQGRMARAYIIEQEDGEKRQFYGNTVLDARLPNVQIGSMIKIVYLGTEPSKVKGQNPYKNFEVYESDGSEGPDESATSTAKPVTKAKGKVPF